MIVNNERITFEPEKHHYFNQEGQRLLSVTQLVHAFTPEFDPDGSILARKAEEEGITPAEMQARWTAIKDESCVIGTEIHKLIEDYINTKEIQAGKYRWAVEQFAALKFEGTLQSETLLSNSELGIAGTIDLIEDLNNGFVNIWDFKTNKRLDKFSIFGNKMLAPVSNLFSTNFIHYTLQLNIYSAMLEELGYWVKNLNLIYINRKKEKLEIHPIQFRPYDTKKIIKLARKVLAAQETH